MLDLLMPHHGTQGAGSGKAQGQNGGDHGGTHKIRPSHHDMPRLSQAKEMSARREPGHPFPFMNPPPAANDDMICLYILVLYREDSWSGGFLVLVMMNFPSWYSIGKIHYEGRFHTLKYNGEGTN